MDEKINEMFMNSYTGTFFTFFHCCPKQKIDPF